MRRPRVYIYAVFLSLASALLVPHIFTALLAVITTALWGEWLLLWLYGRYWPLEPYRERVQIGRYTAAYDPRRKMYHLLWEAEPTRSEFGISAAQTLHEMYASLALQPGEYLAVVQLGSKRFVRLTTKALDEARISHVEAVLRTYFVLHPTTWVSTKVPPERWLYYAAAAPILLTPANPAYAAVALLLLWHAYNIRRWYRHADLELAFVTASTKRDVGTSRQTLEVFASAEAVAVAKMERWAVVFAPRPEASVEREFGKAYESPVEKRGVVVKLQKTSQLLERMLKHDERPIYMQVFGSRPLATQLEIRRDWLATVLFWTPSPAYMTKALSHDLSRAPIFYGGRLMSSGRRLFVGFDKFDRPVEVDIDSMPTAHAVILGPSGMGKSWAVASLLLRLAKSHDLQIVVIDPHGDYLSWARLAGARVFETPRQIPRLGQIWRNRYVPALLAEYGVVGAPPAEYGSRNGVDISKAVEYMAQAAGVERVEEVDPPAGHVVWDLRLLKDDAAAQSFFVSLILLWYLTQQAKRPAAEKVERVVAVDEAALLLHGARVAETGLVTNTVLNLIRQYSMGGRKYGFALWLIAQLARHLPEDIIENAGFVLQLGGTRRALRKSVEVLMLDRYDFEYLRSATTPRETVGGSARGRQPYAMGLLYLSPRDLIYHVKIPLYPELKEAV